MACTPNDPERVSPPEDGEIVDTPPHSSPQATLNPAPKAVAKPLIQQIVEKKAPPQIASGFESWIPKEKLNAPAPSIPKSVSAFGVPLKPPNAESERPKVAPSSQPNPWEKLAKSTSAAASNSLFEALSKVQADNFSGGGSTPSYSKSYLEEMNRVMSTRKRVVEEAAEVQKSKFFSDLLTGKLFIYLFQSQILLRPVLLRLHPKKQKRQILFRQTKWCLPLLHLRHRLPQAPPVQVSAGSLI